MTSQLDDSQSDLFLGKREKANLERMKATDFRRESHHIIRVLRAVMRIVEKSPHLIDIQRLPQNPKDLEGEQPISITQGYTYRQSVDLLEQLFPGKTKELPGDTDRHVLVTYTKYEVHLLSIRLHNRLMSLLGITDLDTFKFYVTLLVNHIITTSLNPENVKNMILDPLTGHYNRKAFDSLFTAICQDITVRRSADTLQRNSSTRRSVGGFLIMFDIDYFKTINDLFGHNQGDELLKKIPGIIEEFAESKNLRYGVDIFAGRRGGEEFAVFIGLPRASDIHIGFHQFVSGKLRGYVLNHVSQAGIIGSVNIQESRKELQALVKAVLPDDSTNIRKMGLWIKKKITEGHLDQASNYEQFIQSNPLPDLGSIPSDERKTRLFDGLKESLSILIQSLQTRKEHLDKLKRTAGTITAGAVYIGRSGFNSSELAFKYADKEGLYHGKNSGGRDCIVFVEGPKNSKKRVITGRPK